MEGVEGGKGRREGVELGERLREVWKNIHSSKRTNQRHSSRIVNGSDGNFNLSGKAEFGLGSKKVEGDQVESVGGGGREEVRETQL